jgi:hypothetical protein
VMTDETQTTMPSEATAATGSRSLTPLVNAMNELLEGTLESWAAVVVSDGDHTK